MTGPSLPPELADRIACDAAARVTLDVEPLIARTAERLRESDHWNAMIASDEIATDVVEDIWLDEGLAEAYARALADVHEQYLAQGLRVIEAIELLEAEGSESWIAGAIGHRFSSHIAWQALDRLDLLTALPLDAFCAGCGAELEGPEATVSE